MTDDAQWWWWWPYMKCWCKNLANRYAFKIPLDCVWLFFSFYGWVQVVAGSQRLKPLKINRLSIKRLLHGDVSLQEEKPNRFALGCSIHLLKPYLFILKDGRIGAWIDETCVKLLSQTLRIICWQPFSSCIFCYVSKRETKNNQIKMLLNSQTFHNSLISGKVQFPSPVSVGKHLLVLFCFFYFRSMVGIEQ